MTWGYSEWMPTVVQEISKQRTESCEAILGKYVPLIFFLLVPRNPLAVTKYSILKQTGLLSDVLWLVQFSHCISLNLKLLFWLKLVGDPHHCRSSPLPPKKYHLGS